MIREYHRWNSPALGRDMEMLVFGHAGARVIAFPTSMGRFYQWEDFGLVGTLSEHLERGWIQLFCVDSVDGESWYANNLPPGDRARRHDKYDQYVLNEVLPFTATRNGTPYIMTAGPSFGAYHAINFALRHPQVINRAIGMSGLYDLARFTGSSTDTEVYFNNPCAYIPNEHDPERLAALRRLDLILAIGRDDPSCWSDESLSTSLWQKDIGNALRIWDGWAHDWPFWKQMIHIYINGHD